MAANCINKSSKEFKELQNEVPSLSSNLLAARVAIFQKKNNTDRFPSFNEVFSGEVDKAYNNFTAIYEGEPAFKQVATLEQFVTFSRFYPNDINVENLKKFVAGNSKPKLVDVEKRVEEEANNLARGKGITKEEFKEAKDSMSVVTDKAIKKTSNKVGDKTYDGEGRLSSVRYSVIPGHNKLGKPQNVYSLALKAVDNVNAELVHAQDNSPVARLVQVSDTEYEVRFTYSLSKAVYRANFDIKDTLMSAKNREKLFQKKALEQFLLSGLITEEEYLKIKENKKLDSIKMSLEEMRLDMVPGRAKNFAGGTRKGLYVDNLEVGRTEDTDIEEDFQEDFDTVDNLDVRDPVNIEKFRAKRESQIDTLTKKIEDLSNRRRATGRNKFYTEKIKYFEDISKRFQEELESADMEKNPLKLVRESFEQDMKVIKEIHQDPSLDNIFLARDLMQTLKNNVSDFKEGYDNYFYKDNRTLEDVASLTKGLNDEIMSLSSEQQTLTTEFFLNLVERYQDTINEYKGLSREELKDKLNEAINDTEVFSRYAGALGKDLIVNDIIGKIIRAETDIEEQREISKTAPIAQKLDNMTSTLQDKLKKLGYVLGGKTNWMDAFTRNTLKGDLELVSKFSESWGNFVKSVVFDTRTKVYTHNKNGEYREANATLITKYNRLKDVADFIDFTVLPEIQENFKDDDFFSGKFNPPDNSYSKELKERLGEEEYKSLLNRQINFLEEYKLKHADITAHFLSERAVDTVEELTEAELNVLNQRLNIIDPFFFTNNGNIVPFTSSKGNTFNKAHTLDYNTFIPKEFDGEGKPTNFLDEKFKKIEGDPELYEAWKTLEDAVFLINSNVAGSSRLNLNKRSILYLERSIKNMYSDDNFLKKQTKRFRDFLQKLIQTIKDGLSSRDKVNKDTNLNEVILPSQMKSFKSRVFSTWMTDLQDLNNILDQDKKIKESSSIDLTVITPNKIDKILEVFDLKSLKELKEITRADLEDFTIKDFKQATQKKVYNQQTLDLPSLLKAMLNFSASHKARETANNIVSDVIDPGLDSIDYYENAKNLESKKNFFEKRVLKNDTSKKTWFNFSREIFEKLGKDGVISFGKIGALGINLPLNMYTKNMTSDEKRINRVGRKRLEKIRELKEKISNPEELSKLKSEEREILNRLGQLGADYTLGNMFESVYIKLFIYAKLGLNFKAATMNLIQARQQALIKAGYLDKNGNLVGDYTSQQFQTADSFSFGMAADRFAGVLNKKPSEQNAIAGALIGSLNVIQDGTDIFQRSERTGVSQGPELSPGKKEFWDAMKTTEVAEYYNQVPIILSVFMNYKMPDGNPMFTGSEFPYHEIKDGVFKIKDEYLDSFEDFTPEQLKAEYETFSSEKALRFRANLKGNVLTKRNGDYTNTGVVEAKGSIVGATTMTFSTWVYALTYSGWAINQSNVLTGESDNGHYVELLLSEKGRSMMLPLMTQNIATAGLMGAGAATAFGIAAGASSALIALSPFILGIGLLTMAAKRGTTLDSEETGGFIKKATRAITGISKDTLKLTGHNFLIAPFKPLVEKIMGAYNRRAKKKVDWFNDQKYLTAFDYSLNGKLNENEALALRQGSEQQALLQFTTMLMAGVVTAISSLGADEEEDEPKKKIGEDGRKEDNELRYEQDKQRKKDYWWYKMKYISGNMIQQSYQDLAINLNPFAMIYSLFGDDKSSKLVSPGVDAFTFALDAFSGEKVRKPGHLNYGDRKSTKILKGLVFPPLRNIDKISEDNWMLGFETLAQGYYTSNPMVNAIEQTDYKKYRAESRKERTDLKNRLKDPDELVEFFPKDSREKLKKAFFGGDIKSYSRLPLQNQELIDKLIKGIVEVKSPIIDRGYFGDENQEATETTEFKKAQIKLKEDIIESVLNGDFENEEDKIIKEFEKAVEKFEESSNNKKE